MELEIYRALVKINVPADDAQAVADSIQREIERQNARQAEVLATKRDLAETKAEIIKAIADSQRWTITAMFGAIGLFAAITKIWH